MAVAQRWVTSSPGPQGALEAIAEAISGLERLSNTIRWVSHSNLNAMPEEILKDNESAEGARAVQEFEDQVLMVIKANYPHANENVQKRLACSLSRQRRRLIYKQALQERQTPYGEVVHPASPEEHTDESSMRAGTTSFVDDGEIRIPAPPDIAEDGNDIKCPYCYIVLSEEDVQEQNWRYVQKVYGSLSLE